MATVCVDPNCKTYLKGEVIPVAVDVKSTSESAFEIVPLTTRTYCEIKTSSGEFVTKLFPRLQSVTDYHKQLFCSWDTTSIEAGYYILRYWVSINISGARDGNNDLVEDYRLASESLNRYIKVD